MKRSVGKWLWFATGMASLGLGMLGAVLPFLPTTCFVLLAAYAFSRSSERWHNWLMHHKAFGPLIRDWNRHGAISIPAKCYASMGLIGAMLVSLLLGFSPTVLIAQAVVMSASAAFILTRPAPPDPATTPR